MVGDIEPNVAGVQGVIWGSGAACTDWQHFLRGSGRALAQPSQEVLPETEPGIVGILTPMITPYLRGIGRLRKPVLIHYKEGPDSVAELLPTVPGGGGGSHNETEGVS